MTILPVNKLCLLTYIYSVCMLSWRVCAVQYTSEFVQSHLLSRRLAYFCCKKLSQICTDSSSSLLSPSSQSTSAAAASLTSNECVIWTLFVFSLLVWKQRWLTGLLIKPLTSLLRTVSDVVSGRTFNQICSSFFFRKKLPLTSGHIRLLSDGVHCVKRCFLFYS